MVKKKQIILYKKKDNQFNLILKFKKIRCLSFHKIKLLDDLSNLEKFYINLEKYFTSNIEIENIEKNSFNCFKNLKELYLRCKSLNDDSFNGLNNLNVLKTVSLSGHLCQYKIEKPD